MALEPTDLLARATRAVREEPAPTGWFELSDTIMARVRAIVVPAAPVLCYGPDGQAALDEAGSRTYVATRVIVASLPHPIRGVPGVALESVHLSLAAGELSGLEVSLAVVYGTVLADAAERTRRAVGRQLDELIGPHPRFTAESVDVCFVDLVGEAGEL